MVSYAQTSTPEAPMYGSIIRPIERITREECCVVAYYLFNFCSHTDNFESCDECQKLLHALTVTFKREVYAALVADAFIKKLVKEKRLTPLPPSETYKHPFDVESDLEQNFKEDAVLAKKLRRFTTDSLFDIQVCRCFFAGKKEHVAALIAHILFPEYTPEEYDGAISMDITIPDHIKKAVENVNQVAFLSNGLDISYDEMQLLLAAYRMHTIRELYNVYNDLNGDDESAMTMYAKCLNTSLQKIKSLLRTDKKLITYGFIDSDGDVAEDAVDCIFSASLDPFFADILKEETLTQPFPLDSYALKKESAQLVLRFLTNHAPVNILLYGSPGSGKTEYAKTLAHESGLKLLIYKNEAGLTDENAENNALYRLNCLLSIEKKDSLIVVDEAEHILKTTDSFFGMSYSTPQKGIVNKMLENSVNKVIWIVNYTHSFDESTLRRFTYSVKFNEMPQTMLRSIAHTKLAGIGMSGKLLDELVELCSNYHVTGASIDNIIKTISDLPRSGGEEEKMLLDVRQVLEANSELLYGSPKMRKNIRESYDLSVLNTSIPAGEILSMVQNALDYAERNTASRAGVRMLFYGLSGTGKTEFVRYIAEILHKKIVLKRPSDIFGKYVGENEENIKSAFEEARTDNAILLFDEADAFFSNRLDAQHGWERTLVNEFLTQMEEFDGIVVCTTNLRQLMDPAMERRFHIMTEFKALNPQGVKRLFSKYFSGFEFSNTHIGELLKWDSITPGDFDSLAGRIRFMPRDKLSAEYITAELAKMQQEKSANRKIGFDR